MSVKNQINVILSGGQLCIVNADSDPINSEDFFLNKLLHIQRNQFDMAGLNTHQPGQVEFNTPFEFALFFQSDLNHAVKINLANVANQPTWTNDAAGLTQAILDIKAEAASVTPGAPGSGGEVSTQSTDPLRVDEVADLPGSGDTTTYIGYAAAGTLNADATWRIKRVTELAAAPGDTVVEFADGDDDFDNVWNDRNPGTYS